MTGAHRDPLFGQQMRQIRVMHTLDDKTGQRQLRLAQQPNAVARFKAFEQIVMQRCFMGANRVLIKPRKIIQRRAQTNHPGNRRRTCLKTQWRRAEPCAVVIGIQHHFTAELPMAQLLKRFIATEQHAQSIGAVELNT